MKQVHIFTDGSCLGNPGAGGWAALLVLPGTSHSRLLKGGFRLTTNNRMELLAAIEGLSALKFPCQASIFTDSQYLAKAINNKWIESWRARNWQKKGGGLRVNVDLWQKLDRLLAYHSVRFEWLKGHAGHAENEYCDQQARKEAMKADLPADAEYEKTLETVK